MLKHLPPESAYLTAFRESLTVEERAKLPKPTGHGPWSNAELLLANVVDGLNWLAWQQAAINRKKGASPPPKPEPVPRPGVKSSKSGRLVTPIGIMKVHELRVQHAARRASLGDDN